jgi:hypothetical protein
MLIYQTVILNTKGTMDDNGDIVEEPTQTDIYSGYLYTLIYSVVVIIFGEGYKMLAYKQTEDENHRY